LLGQLTTAAAADPWVALTEADVGAIHDLLRDNHPGPPDPGNPHYRDWLAKGLGLAMSRASDARSYDDYVRTLAFYTNGFSDDHVQVYPSLTERLLTWSGFIVVGSLDSSATVAVTESDTGVKVGDRLLSCDGKPPDALLAERTDPYFWNAAIPHARYQQAYRLFYQGRNDPQPKPNSCAFSSGTVQLKWRNTNVDELQPKLVTARGLGAHDPSIRKIGSVWMIAVPTFNFQTAAEVNKAKAFLEELRTRAPELRKETVVFDMRGNGGGSSLWGSDIVQALWSKNWRDYVESQSDSTVDWRASPGNEEALDHNVALSLAEGQPDGAAYYAAARDAIKATLSRHETYARIDDKPTPLPKPDENPVTGRIFVFTDVGCASACLDFMDEMKRLPSVTQIGFPTYADATYIDNTAKLLPSGLAYLSYSMKVYRNRARRNNEWYEPNIRWPGGAVTDESIAAWAATLH
jgi:hypothetical protein